MFSRNNLSSQLSSDKTQPQQNATDNDIQYESLDFDTILPFDTEIDLKQYNSPFKWSSLRKNTCLALCCVATCAAAYSAGSYSVTVGELEAKFHVSSEALQTGVTTWCVGFALSPMFLAPLSELNGRRPVFLVSGFIFFVALIGCAVTQSFAGMLVARFFVGAGSSTFSTMVGGVLSDIYHAQDRNTPMAIYSGFVLCGTGFGPLLSGFIIGRASWRWVFWHQVIALGVLMVAMVILFKESRGSVLLSRKARKINAYLGNLDKQPGASADHDKRLDEQPRKRYVVAADTSKLSIRNLIYLSLTTPFKLLVTEPVVFFFSLWAAFAWGVLYMQLNVLPLVFATNHKFNIEEQGAVFASLVVGTIIATIISVSQEIIAKKRFPKILQVPEGRLYFACLEAALLPVGLFWFGWTTFSSIPWIVPCLAIGCATIGIFSIYLAVFNYLADTYHRYASSALACQSFCRNILAGVFPLFSQVMFRRLGFPGASSLLGGVAALLTIVPWVLVFKGETIRARSKVASEIMHVRR